MKKAGRKLKFNYSYLRGFIKENFGTQEKYAKFLGISPTTLYARLSNESPFTQDDIYKTANKSLERRLTEAEVNLLFFSI